jgi:hypothetical protein
MKRKQAEYVGLYSAEEFGQFFEASGLSYMATSYSLALRFSQARLRRHILKLVAIVSG